MIFVYFLLFFVVLRLLTCRLHVHVMPLLPQLACFDPRFDHRFISLSRFPHLRVAKGIRLSRPRTSRIRTESIVLFVCFASLPCLPGARNLNFSNLGRDSRSIHVPCVIGSRHWTSTFDNETKGAEAAAIGLQYFLFR